MTYRRLYSTCFCYHGCVATFADALTFRSAVPDIQTQITEQRAAGYTFLKPSEYANWRDGTTTYTEPVACIHFDDGLESIDQIVPWLISQGIPCGLSLITRRLRRLSPEQDFLSWTTVKGWVASGLVEVTCHTHNMHNLAPALDPDTSNIISSPVMEGPRYNDAGDVVYRLTGDTRAYWDYSHIDDISLGLPIWGTDPYDSVTPITTTLRITPKETGTVGALRLWMALSRPSGGPVGYSAQVRIEKSTLPGGAWSDVFNGVIGPYPYETRSQWVEREFYSIDLDTAFSVVSGTTYELRFTTSNVGEGAAVIFTLPHNDTTKFAAISTCQGLYPAGSQSPGRSWQYIDYPAGDEWSVRAGIILAFTTGATVDSDASFATYVEDDVQAFRDAVDTYLNATWEQITLYQNGMMPPPDEDKPLYPIVGWDNPARVDATFVGVVAGPLPDKLISAISVELTNPEAFVGGDADPYNTELTAEDRAEAEGRMASLVFEISYSYASITGPWTVLANISAWQILRGQAVDTIDAFSLIHEVSVWYQIRVMNDGVQSGTETTTRWGVKTLTGHHVVSTSAYSGSITEFVYPFGSYYSQFNVTQDRDDIHPTLQTALENKSLAHGYHIDSIRNVVQSEEREPDLRGSDWQLGRWLIYGDQAVDVSLNNLTTYNGNRFDSVNHGGVSWQISLEPDPIGNATVRSRPQVFDFVAFDAYFFSGAGTILRGFLADGGQYFDYEPGTGTFEDGETIAEATTGATAVIQWVEPLIGQMRISSVAGSWNGGLGITGGASGATGTGGTTGGPRLYADDKGWLAARGVRRMLIINNNLATGDPDPTIGAHVVNNPGIYVPLIVSLCVADGWEGITCNLEAIPSANRAAATEFYAQLGRAMHVAGKILHATVPAATGTDYDADFWTGWCDHAEIVRSCDAIKVMSYTETGPGTDPGPAAPDSFWAAVYAYMLQVIPEFYRRRVLCGARMFGHAWSADWSEAEYVTYHQAISYALKYGRRIDIDSTEMGFGLNTGERVWCGTPLTVDRSRGEALKGGLGGVGVWKADDGDIEEFIPVTRQIGRV